MSDSAERDASWRHAHNVAARLKRYHQYEALRPFSCPESTDHYLLEPHVVAGDVLLICPTCGHAELFIEEERPDLSAQIRRAADFWRGVPY